MSAGAGKQSLTREFDWFIAAQGGASSVIDFTSFIGFNYVNGTSLPTKPVENGQFITANKWSNPYKVEVTIAKSGDQSKIKSMLEALETLLQSVDLVDVVTPVKVFTNGNIERIEYTFSGDETGPSMVMPRITIQEIKFFNTSESTGDISTSDAKNAECATGTTTGKCATTECSAWASKRGVGGTSI